MIRTKLGLLGLCAVVLGMMAMSAGSAQAALSWLVLNAAHTVATNLKAQLQAKKDSEHLTLSAELVGLQVNFTCTGVEFLNSFIEPEEKTGDGGETGGGIVSFSGCEAYSGLGPLGTALGCHVKTAGTAVGTIETLPLKGLLELHEIKAGEKEVVLKIEPKVAGAAFADLETSECSLPEINKVLGTLTLKDCQKLATTHALEHLVEQGPLTALFLGAHSAMKLELTKLVGSAWVFLTGAHKELFFAAMDA